MFGVKIKTPLGLRTIDLADDEEVCSYCYKNDTNNFFSLNGNVTYICDPCVEIHREKEEEE